MATTMFNAIKNNHYEVVEVTANGETKTVLAENQLKSADFASKEDFADYKRRVFTLLNALYNAKTNLSRSDNRAVYAQRNLAQTLCVECFGMEKCELTYGELDYLAEHARRSVKSVEDVTHVFRMAGEDGFRRVFERVMCWHINGIKVKCELTAKQLERLNKVVEKAQEQKKSAEPNNK